MTAFIDAMVEEHLRIWNSPPSDQRSTAVAQLYLSTVLVAESDATYRGHSGIEQAIDGLHGALPDMRLELTGPIQTAQDLSTYSWSLGPEGASAIVTGRDVLTIRDGAIAAVYVLIDAPQESSHA